MRTIKSEENASARPFSEMNESHISCLTSHVMMSAHPSIHVANEKLNCSLDKIQNILHIYIHSTNQIKTIENYVKSKEERSKEGQGQQVS